MPLAVGATTTTRVGGAANVGAAERMTIGRAGIITVQCRPRFMC